LRLLSPNPPEFSVSGKGDGSLATSAISVERSKPERRMQVSREGFARSSFVIRASSFDIPPPLAV
jgi:hypothetical protein